MRDARLGPKLSRERNPAIKAANAQMALYNLNKTNYSTDGTQAPAAYTMKTD